jgi:hypothetical protein
VKGTEKVLVSPSFELPGYPSAYKFMINAKVTSEKWGGGSFKNAKSRGIINLKCDEPDMARDQDIHFEISVGRAGSHQLNEAGKFPRQRTRVTHNFGDQGVCQVTKKEWNFLEAIASSDPVFSICLEMLTMEST